MCRSSALDSYYRDLGHLPLEERSRTNFDVPEALDAELLSAQLRSLSAGEEIRVPVYDFVHYVRTVDGRLMKAAEFAVVEGIFTLYWETVRSLLEVKVLVDAGDDLCLSRRLERDVHERGRTPESVIEQYSKV